MLHKSKFKSIKQNHKVDQPRPQKKYIPVVPNVYGNNFNKTYNHKVSVDIQIISDWNA